MKDVADRNPRRGWAWLLLAAVFEISFALATKASQGFTQRDAAILTVITTALGIYCLSRALCHLPVSIGYTVWVGLGAIGTVLGGHWLFGETLTAGRLLSMGVIIAGVIGLQLSGDD